jgi:hypothetical protein
MGWRGSTSALEEDCWGGHELQQLGPAQGHEEQLQQQQQLMSF